MTTTEPTEAAAASDRITVSISFPVDFHGELERHIVHANRYFTGADGARADIRIDDQVERFARIDYSLSAGTLDSLFYFMQTVYTTLSRLRYEEGYAKGQADQFKQKTVVEQFMEMLTNLQVSELSRMAETNEYILHDLQANLPRAIRQMEQLLEQARTSQPLAGVVKPVKMKEGDEIVFTFERKFTRRGKGMVIGLDENKDRISLDYAFLFNATYAAGKTYVIKNSGLYRRGSNAYYRFEITDADQI